MKPLLLDSTLREGEQTPGVSFSIHQKLEIARLLDEFGVDIIEAGHPAVTPEISKSVRIIAKENLRAEILAHCRAMKYDIDAAHGCGVDWVGIFFCISDKSLEERFRKSEEEVIRIITTAIKYAKSLGLKVRYTPEDTVRSDFHRVIKVSRAAVEAGADRISVADTGGIMTPLTMFSFIRKMKQNLDVPINVHCHNDLGMATANSLSAIEAGADLVDVTVNGLGERTGIAPLQEVCVALKLAYDNHAEWKLNMLPGISRTVARYSGIEPSKQAPIIGRNAFTHNAGLHVSALLKNPYHYETIPCQMVGRQRRVVIDKFASKEGIRYKLEMLHMEFDDTLVDSLHEHIKTNEHNWLSDNEFITIAHQVKNGNIS